MTEGRVAKVVREAQRFGQILVEAQGTRDGAADLRDFDAVRQAHPEMIAVRRNEDLRLVAKAPERNRVDDAIAVSLEDVARSARSGIRLGMEAPARLRGLRGNAAWQDHGVPSGTI
jgi:hypothetical protein